MTITVEAVYENGVLKPVRALPLNENQRVDVVIHTPQVPAIGDAAADAAKQAALQRFLSIELPVGDWEPMEDEIIRGAIE